jgi:hypothetical protein
MNWTCQAGRTRWLKIIVERSKLLGLDRQPEDDRAQQTIVIGGTSEEYVAGLKAVIAASEGTEPKD